MPVDVPRETPAQRLVKNGFLAVTVFSIVLLIVMFFMVAAHRADLILFLSPRDALRLGLPVAAISLISCLAFFATELFWIERSYQRRLKKAQFDLRTRLIRNHRIV